MHPFQFQSYLPEGLELNIYATPAIITLILLTVETFFLAVALPETRGTTEYQNTVTSEKSNKDKSNGTKVPPVISRLQRLNTLKKAKDTHFYFLTLFSGILICSLHEPF
jgi:hypothetical protein